MVQLTSASLSLLGPSAPPATGAGAPGNADGFARSFADAGRADAPSAKRQALADPGADLPAAADAQPGETPTATDRLPESVTAALAVLADTPAVEPPADPAALSPITPPPGNATHDDDKDGDGDEDSPAIDTPGDGTLASVIAFAPAAPLTQPAAGSTPDARAPALSSAARPPAPQTLAAPTVPASTAPASETPSPADPAAIAQAVAQADASAQVQSTGAPPATSRRAVADRAGQPRATAATDLTASEAPLIGVAQPAARAFAAAIAAAERTEGQHARLSPAGEGEGRAILSGVHVQPVPHAATITGPDQPIDTRHDGWLDRLIDRIDALRDAANAQDTRVRLIPDALGKIDVALRKSDDGVQVHFTAEVPATRQLLADAQPRLAQLAEQRGLKLAETSVGWAGSQAQAQSQHQQQRETAQPPRPASALAQPAPTSTETETEPETLARLA